MPLESGRTLIIWKSDDAFDVCFRRTIGVRGNPEKKKKIGNSEKKIWVAAILAGRSEHSKLTKF